MENAFKSIGNFTLPTYGNRHGVRRQPSPRHYGDIADGEYSFEIFASFDPCHSGRGEALNFGTVVGFSKELSPIRARQEFGTARMLFPEFFAPAVVGTADQSVEFDTNGNIVGDND